MKRDQIKRRPLADTVINGLEPEATAYRVLDGNGLYLRVKPDGRKSWELRYKKPDGKWSWLGLGPLSTTNGRQARQKARDALSLDNPAAYNEHTPAKPRHTFRESAERWLSHKSDLGRSHSSLRQMRMYLDNDILPVLGDMDITRITRADCTMVQDAMEARGALNVAGKVRSWMRQIFSHAVARGLIDSNPASELRHIAKPAPESTQYPHLKESELHDFFVALSRSNSRAGTINAVRMMVYTAVRPGMIRAAEWSEIDVDIWRVPAAKMKMRRDYVTPLSDQVIDLLTNQRQLSGRSRYIFPGDSSMYPTLSNSALNNALNLIGYKGRLVGHGARHTASTLLREHGWHRDWVEVQLAHKECGVAGVYNQATYLDGRRAMMQWLADYYDDLFEGMGDEMRAVYDSIVNVIQYVRPSRF
ncbi:tyrosine-type recombinase/integrase [Carnimonas bestiolae]|uniref:tyrosine-type recombinase/integrase n=1 Tax=Carnimonas bestiolae TaxID=3402172 RepID=UPI003EDC7D04